MDSVERTLNARGMFVEQRKNVCMIELNGEQLWICGCINEDWRSKRDVFGAKEKCSCMIELKGEQL